jgi:hypothetical protein
MSAPRNTEYYDEEEKERLFECPFCETLVLLHEDENVNTIFKMYYTCYNCNRICFIRNLETTYRIENVKRRYSILIPEDFHEIPIEDYDRELRNGKIIPDANKEYAGFSKHR